MKITIITSKEKHEVIMRKGDQTEIAPVGQKDKPSLSIKIIQNNEIELIVNPYKIKNIVASGGPGGGKSK